jgi:hypothetical protein
VFPEFLQLLFPRPKGGYLPKSSDGRETDEAEIGTNEHVPALDGGQQDAEAVPQDANVKER